MDTQKTFFESKGLILRKLANILWFFLPLIVAIGLVLATGETIETSPVEIVDDACYIEEYYEYLQETTCSLEITFNQNVYEGSVTVVFYDEYGVELETLSIPLTNADYFPSYGTEMVNTYFSVEGKVDSYEIIDYSDLQSAEEESYNESRYEIVLFAALLMIIRCPYALPILITALFFNCKRYLVNGHEIIVYTGRLQHYIKVDGKKYDQKNALISLSPITLNAVLDTQERIEVYIPSFTKRMTVRVDGVVANPSR